MHQSLAAILFPAYRRRVLGLLLLRPDEALHGREIARRTGLPAGTLTRELKRLTDVGLLKREKRGNQQVYSADTSCPVFHEVSGILRKTSGLADGLAEARAPQTVARRASDPITDSFLPSASQPTAFLAKEGEKMKVKV